MRISARVFVLAFAATSILAAGCSNNKGKIEGTKWTGNIENVPGATMTVEFAADGKHTMTISAAGVNKVITGKWKLSSGDYVDLYDLSEALAGSTKHREKITINGNTLVMTDSDGKSVTFQKVN